MKSEILSKIRNKTKILLKNKEILDVIVFGSAVKGKVLPRDIDLAIISKSDIKVNLDGFHVSILSIEDFFKPISLINTLLREGYSLRHNKSFSEIYGFSNKVLFIYELSSLNSSTKVKIVNILRGKGKEEGMVKQNKGEWLANQVFTSPIGSSDLFEKFFINFKVKFKKSYILIH